MRIDHLVFSGFNRRVVAVDRETGDIVWTWKAPKGMSYVSLLLDGDRLIVAVDGYLYCLDPDTGVERWSNPLKGLGTGVTSLASVRGSTHVGLQAASAAAQTAAAAAAT